MTARLTHDIGDGSGPAGFRAGLRAMAEDAPAAPGLFDAVAEGARRRHAARVRTGSALAVAGMVAAGAVWWGASSHEADPEPHPTATAPPASTTSESPSFRSFPALACPTTVGVPRTAGASDHLLDASSAYLGTLCETSGGKVTAVRLAPMDLVTLMHDLAKAPPTPVGYCYPDEDPVPKSSLILRYAGLPDQELLVAGLTCGIVTNGAYAVIMPDDLMNLLGGPSAVETGNPR